MAAEPQSYDPEKLTAGTTVQWHTCAHNRMYTEEDCSYFALVLIPREEVWWMPSIIPSLAVKNPERGRRIREQYGNKIS